MPAVRYWLPSALWAAAIFAESSCSTVPVPSVHGWPLDKVGHAGIYAVLGALLVRAFAKAERFPTWAAGGLAVFFATAFGFSDETHQAFVPGRDCDVFDVLADFAGAAAAVVIFALWRERKRRSPRSGVSG